MNDLLRVEGLDCFYGDVQVLHGIGLAVAEAEVLCLLGRNGAGKTTLLKAIMGLAPARAGSIRLEGEELTALPAHEVPKAGVFAVRAAPILAANLRAALAGGPLERHVPNPRYLALVSTGRKCAVGMWGPLSWKGRWAWHWKDHIDRKFVARYR